MGRSDEHTIRGRSSRRREFFRLFVSNLRPFITCRSSITRLRRRASPTTGARRRARFGHGSLSALFERSAGPSIVAPGKCRGHPSSGTGVARRERSRLRRASRARALSVSPIFQRALRGPPGTKGLQAISRSFFAATRGSSSAQRRDPSASPDRSAFDAAVVGGADLGPRVVRLTWPTSTPSPAHVAKRSIAERGERRGGSPGGISGAS